MKFLLITGDRDMARAARQGIPSEDQLKVMKRWRTALDRSEGFDMILVDMLATLEVPHHVAGYEEFAAAKMAHPVAAPIPLVLISPEPEYAMDFVAGFPGLLFAHVRRPVGVKFFRRASTWI